MRIDEYGNVVGDNVVCVPKACDERMLDVMQDPDANSGTSTILQQFAVVGWNCSVEEYYGNLSVSSKVLEHKDFAKRGNREAGRIL